MVDKFKIQKVLVTGAQGALGKVVADCYANAGCQVTGAVFGESGRLGKAERSFQPIELNLADPNAVRTALARQAFDVVVHCAGGFRYAPMDQAKDDDLNFLVDANLKGAFYLLREVLSPMKAKGFGRIVLIGAKATLHPGPGLGPYAASKAGLNMLVESIAEEVKGWDININAILPSVIDTEANRKAMPDSDFSKWVSPRDLAEIIYSLTSPWGKAIHGALTPVAGRV
jgi:NAD(P)-dependent dehydrogenase (short-subunit alcohol dehydrogenase family)